MSLVSIERIGRLGLIRLERPKAINALNLEMIEIMLEALEGWSGDPEIGAVLLEGAGEKGFCAGGDVRAVREMVLRGDFSAAERLFAAEYRLNHLLATSGKPVATLAHGVTMGGGIGLASHARYRFARSDARYAMPEGAIGFIVDVGVNAILAKTTYERAMLFLLSGQAVGVADAIGLGLADCAFEPDRTETIRERIMAAAGATDPDAALTQLMQAQGINPGEAVFCVLADRLAGRLQGDDAQSLIETLSRSGEEDPALAGLVSLMRSRSPTSLEAIFQAQLRARRGSSLSEVLADDLALARFAIRQPDFIEGVRAVLVDKDGAPRWSPERLSKSHKALILRALSTS